MMENMQQDDTDMELEELAKLKEYARQGMAKGMGGMHEDEGGPEQPVPGAEPVEGSADEEKMDMAGMDSGSQELSPELLQQLIAALSAKG